MNKKNIYLMYIIIFLQSLVFYGSIATLYRTQRGISLGQIYFIESVYFIIVIVMELPWGYIADRFGYKKTLIIANFIYFLSKILFYKAHSFIGFLFERIFLAIALAGLSGCDMAYLYNSIDEKKLSDKVFSRYNFYATLGFLAASTLSSLIVQISIESTVFFTIIAYGIAFILSLFLGEVKKENINTSIKKDFKELLNNRGIILFIISITLVSEVVQSITVFLNQEKYISCGIDLKYFGIILALSQIICLATGKVYKIKKHFGEKKYILGIYIGIIIAVIMLIFTSSALISVLSVMLVALSNALMTPVVMSIQNDSITSGDRATILSMYSIIGSVFSGIVNPVIGIAADYSLTVSFVICMIMVIEAYILMRTYLKSRIIKE